MGPGRMAWWWLGAGWWGDVSLEDLSGVCPSALLAGGLDRARPHLPRVSLLRAGYSGTSCKPFPTKLPLGEEKLAL